MRLSLIALSLLCLSACGEKPAPAPEKPAEPAAPAAPEKPAEPAAPATTLKELQNGDAACYVVVTRGTEELNIAGSFDLCPGGPQDASALVGKTVNLTVGKQKVMAGSCQGNPECKDTEEVDFVSAIAAAP